MPIIRLDRTKRDPYSGIDAKKIQEFDVNMANHTIDIVMKDTAASRDISLVRAVVDMQDGSTLILTSPVRRSVERLEARR